MDNCGQACPYNTLDGCKAKEYNAICPLTNIETPITEYSMTNADRIRAMSGLDDFEEFDDDTVADIADCLIAKGVVVPVHCKDCKHWADGVAGCTEHIKCCKIGFYMVGENGYCVFGERRTDDKETG